MSEKRIIKETEKQYWIEPKNMMKMINDKERLREQAKISIKNYLKKNKT